jgi:hypothetical protein
MDIELIKNESKKNPIELNRIFAELNKRFKNVEDFMLRYAVFCADIADQNNLYVEIDGQNNAIFWDKSLGINKPIRN